MAKRKKSAPDRKQDRDGLTVFISSTSEDLKPHRAAARDAAVAAGILPIQMETFPASGEHPPLKACLQKVSAADVVVLIVAHRYGWVPEEQDGGLHKSITWLECEQAKAENKEVLAFLIDESHAWPTEMTEANRIAAAVNAGSATPELFAEVQRNVEQLKAFKKWIDGIGVRAKFTTETDLGWKVSQALADWKQRHATPHAPAPHKQPARSQPPTVPPAYREWLMRQAT